MAYTESSQKRLSCLQHLQKRHYEERRWYCLGSDHPHSKLFPPSFQEAPIMLEGLRWRGQLHLVFQLSLLDRSWNDNGDKSNRMVIWCHLGTCRSFGTQRKIFGPSQIFGNYQLAPLLLTSLPLGHLFPWLLILHITVGRCICFLCLHHKDALLPTVMCFTHSAPLGRCWEGSLTSGCSHLVGFSCFPISCPQPPWCWPWPWFLSPGHPWRLGSRWLQLFRNSPFISIMKQNISLTKASLPKQGHRRSFHKVVM